MRTIIAGSRGITDMQLLLEAIRKAQRGGLKITTILCGGANGVDALGKEYAARNSIPIEYYPADWNKHGRSAGFIRNQEMVHKAEALIALWDNKSKGTKHTIDLAEKAGLKLHLSVILPKKTVEEKLYNTMSSEDKQKILDFIKEKTDIVDKEIKEENPKEEIKEPEKKVEEPKKEETQPLPGPLSVDNPVSQPSGFPGSKWHATNRHKNDSTR